MIVVSDTSPLNYLVLIELQDILPKLFDRIVIPGAVNRELRSPAAPDAIKRFLSAAPDWLEVQASSEMEQELGHLDPGEHQAIRLALRMRAHLVLLDERGGRQAARDQGLAVSGTLGVLDLADRRGLVRLREAIDRLKATNFRVSPRVLRQFGRFDHR